MKNFILILIFTSILVSAFYHSLNKSVDNRCAYYATLKYETEVMKGLCK